MLSLDLTETSISARLKNKKFFAEIYDVFFTLIRFYSYGVS